MKKKHWLLACLIGVSMHLVFLYTCCVFAKDRIILGAVMTMTGPGAMVGVEHKWAYEQAVSDINKKGGVYVKELGKRLPLKIIFADDRTDPAQAAAAVERLIKREKVDFVLGTTQDLLNAAAAPIADKYGRLYVTTTYWPETFLSQNHKWVALSFFTAADLLKSSVAIMDILPESIRPKKVCVIVPDTPDGHAFGGGASKTVPALGYELALYETYPEGTKDFSSSILKMKQKGIEAVVYYGHSTDAITLIRQIKEQDFNPKYVWGARGMWPVEFYETLKSDADYICHDGHWSEAFGYGISKELAERFAKDFRGRTSVTIGNFYSVIQGLVKAIELAGSIDNKKVRDVYYSGHFVVKDTPVGDLKFNEKGLAIIPPVGLQWYKGQRMPVWPPRKDLWTLKLIPAWKERGQ